MENKVLGLDGKMYDKPVDEIKNIFEDDVNVNTNTGMIMDAVQNTTDVKLDDTNSVSGDAVTGKLDEKTLQRLMAYKNRKPSVREYKIGRNDPCPCGSGKKYKNCCLASGKYEQYTKKK